MKSNGVKTAAKRQKSSMLCCMPAWRTGKKMFGGTAAFRVLFGDLPGRAFSEDLR